MFLNKLKKMSTNDVKICTRIQKKMSAVSMQISLWLLTINQHYSDAPNLDPSSSNTINKYISDTNTTLGANTNLQKYQRPDRLLKQGTQVLHGGKRESETLFSSKTRSGTKGKYCTEKGQAKPAKKALACC